MYANEEEVQHMNSQHQ